MKNITYYSFVAAITLAIMTTGCKREEDDIFDKSAANRMTEAITTYKTRLAEAKGGWLMEYYPTTSASSEGVLICAKFNTDGSVEVGTINNYKDDGQTAPSYESDISAWDVIADNGPVLTFNTYNNCIHYFSDPSIYKTAYGYEGDYEFTIISMGEGADNAMLKGKKSKAYINCSQLPEGTDFKEYLEGVRTYQSEKFPSSAPNYNLLHIGDSLYRVEDIATKTCNIYPYNGDNVADESYHKYLLTRHSNGKYYIRFNQAFSFLDQEMQEFELDEEADVFNCVGNSNVKLTGADPTTFFVSKFKESTYTSTKEASDSLLNLVAALTKEMKAKKQDYKRFTLTLTNDTTMTLNLVYGSKNAKAPFIFSCKEDGGVFSFKYKEPGTTAGGNLVAAFPHLDELLRLMTGDFVIDKAHNAFDLTLTTLSRKDDKDLWMIFTL